MFHNFPSNFSSTALNQRLKNLQGHYRLLLDTQEKLQERLRKVIPDVRRQRVQATVLDNIIADLRYQCLHESEMNEFRNNVEVLLAKAILIEKLKNDRIEYVNALDVSSNGRKPTTNEEIDILIKRSFSNENGSVILWYSGDRLKREQTDRWNQIYQQLISERQQAAEPTKLVYADFTQCQQRLEGCIIVRLQGTRSNPIKGKRLDEKEGIVHFSIG
jgi:hypothetical protein